MSAAHLAATPHVRQKSSNGAASEPTNQPHVRETGAPRNTILVEIKPDQRWQQAFRHTLQIAANFEGRDLLQLVLANQKLSMRFPSNLTHSCPELVAAIKEVPGVLSVVSQAHLPVPDEEDIT